MRSKSYGDKQREAQQRKKQEELWKKSHPESAPPPEAPAPDADPAGKPTKTTKKNKPRGRPE
jgi:hypothetical protein